MTKKDYNPSKAHQDATRRNPIEEAIGDRAIPAKLSQADLQKVAQDVKKAVIKKGTISIPLNPSVIPDEPSPSEMVTLEELNRQTEERFLGKPEEEMTEIPITTVTGKTANVPQAAMPPQKILVSKPDLEDELTGEKLKEMINPTPQQFPKKITHVLKPDLPSVTETSSQESPPQGTGPNFWICPDCGQEIITTNLRVQHTCIGLAGHNKTAEKIGIPKIETPPVRKKVDMGALGKHINDPSAECPDCGECTPDVPKTPPPAEDKEFVALREYILDNGFTAAGVAMHIVVICAQPMVSPSTTDWDFADRAYIPDMVFALLRQPGYLEGIWPSLKVVMGTNKANAAWTAGIATTLAFFDVIRTIPALRELQNELEKKS